MQPPELENELRDCNELQLSSRRIVEIEGEKNVHTEDPLPVEQTLQKEKVVQQQTQHQNPQQATTSSPPFPEKLIISRPFEYPDFDLLGELKNLCIKIPLLQAI